MLLHASLRRACSVTGVAEPHEAGVGTGPLQPAFGVEGMRREGIVTCSADEVVDRLAEYGAATARDAIPMASCAAQC